MRSFWLIPISVGLLSSAAQAAPLTFREAVAFSERAAPSLRAKAADIEAARAAAIAAGQLPDPKLGFGIEGFPISGPFAGRPNRDDFSDVHVGISQDVPSGAKRKAAKARAETLIGTAVADAAVERRSLHVSAALAWIDLLYAERRLAALDDVAHVIAEMRQTAPSQLVSGNQRPAQTLEAERLQAGLEDRRAELTAAVGKARAELVRWTYDADIDVSGDPPTFDFDPALLRAGLDHIPSLATFDAASAQADADVAIAKADKHPDWGWEVGYQRRDPRFGDMIMAGVTISLPVFGKSRQDPIIAARQKTANRVVSEREAARRALTATLDTDLADHAMHHNQLERARSTLIPLAQRRVTLERNSYAAGTANLSDVLTALIALAETRLDALDREAAAVRDGAHIALTYGNDDQ